MWQIALKSFLVLDFVKYRKYFVDDSWRTGNDANIAVITEWGDDATSLFYNYLTCASIPFLKIVFPVSIKCAHCSTAKIVRCASHPAKATYKRNDSSSLSDIILRVSGFVIRKTWTYDALSNFCFAWDVYPLLFVCRSLVCSIILLHSRNSWKIISLIDYLLEN